MASKRINICRNGGFVRLKSSSDLQELKRELKVAALGACSRSMARCLFNFLISVAACFWYLHV